MAELGTTAHAPALSIVESTLDDLDALAADLADHIAGAPERITCPAA